MVKVRDLIEIMDTVAPRWMAAEGDPIGLHAGDPRANVKKVMLALDASLDAVREAKKKKCQMIISHHPRFYRGLKNLDESRPEGKLAAEIVRAKLAVFCAHTNLDIAPGGVNDALADIAGIQNPRTLKNYSRDKMLKLTVFVPDSHLDAVRVAICDAGAGVIGEYEDCTFRVPGIGSFRGSDASKPYCGKAGEYEEVEEWRLEAALPASARRAVELALRDAHPYEEVAFDVYELAAEKPYGCGRVGSLKKETTLAALAKKMKKACASLGTTVLGDAKKKIRKLATWCGGGCPVSLVIKSGVDAVVLGEIGYHDTELLQQAGVACVMLGHGSSEEIILPRLQEDINNAFSDIEVEIYYGGTPKMWSV